MGLTVQHGKIARIEKLTVERDLSGGVKIALGGKAAVISPTEAVGLAQAILQAAGVTVEFKSRVTEAALVAS